MNARQIQLMLELCNTQSSTFQTEHMAQFIVQYLHDMDLNPTKDKYGNIYVTKETTNPDYFPTMVCHIDTVHDINYNAKALVTCNHIISIDTETFERVGTGGDDKVGIYITLECLRKFDNFKAVFFLDEEHGCLGSRECNFKYFNDSSFVLQCDRRGSKDFVNNIAGFKLFGDSTQELIQPTLDKYKRVITTGGMTDVQQIANKTNIACANMSCGYYDPHTDNEYISIQDVNDTLNLCIDLFTITEFSQQTVNAPRYTAPHYDYANVNRWTYLSNYEYNASYYNSNKYKSFQTNEDESIDLTTNKVCCPDCKTVAEYDHYDETYYCYNCYGELLFNYNTNQYEVHVV